MEHTNRYGEHLSQECAEGRHSQCNETMDTCACTFRGAHNTLHRYLNEPSAPAGGARDVHEEFAELVYSFEPTEDGMAEKVAACAVDNFLKFAAALSSQTSAYWESRAKTAELKVLTFNEAIAQLRQERDALTSDVQMLEVILRKALTSLSMGKNRQTSAVPEAGNVEAEKSVASGESSTGGPRPNEGLTSVDPSLQEEREARERAERERDAAQRRADEMIDELNHLAGSEEAYIEANKRAERAEERLREREDRLKTAISALDAAVDQASPCECDNNGNCGYCVGREALAALRKAMKAFDDDGTELVRCQNCENGTWWTECCNGADGCDCKGQPVCMGTCNVCGGSGWHRPDADTRANLRTIEGRCFIGRGPTSGYWAGR